MKAWLKSIGIAVAYGIALVGCLLGLAWIANNFSLAESATGFGVIFFVVVIVIIRYTMFEGE